MAILARPRARTSYLRGYEFYNFGRGLHENHSYENHLKCMSRENIFENLSLFAYSAPPLTPRGWW